MAKYNALERQTETEVKRAQVVYLFNVLDYTYEKISEITSYAIATIKSYIKKFSYLLDQAKEWFETKAKRKGRTSKYAEMVEWNCDRVENTNGDELLYLIRMYDRDDELMYSKVGTTTRSVEQRMIEHCRYYQKENIGKIIVDKVYNCNEVPAECFESYFRAYYIKKYPNTFKKNDRFKGVLFDLDKADTIYRNCVELG